MPGINWQRLRIPAKYPKVQGYQAGYDGSYREKRPVGKKDGAMEVPNLFRIVQKHGRQALSVPTSCAIATGPQLRQPNDSDSKCP